MSTGEVVHLGPIRPEHVSDGWRLEGDESGGWWLSKRLGDRVATIRGTTPTTCAWSVYRAGGRLLREASSYDVEEAKALADEWIREYR
ncbi:hypothetical protein [Nocardia transvalensis]|uniref:hypothetical protein n=1 Tax=Nocardia transvalensis TaxID=37333 RepID=UPI0018941138|nr:hypothetical protein [Nocardia transvalensis]MBF6328502.1 hypothetical protein [Nocardia transvalensis]